MFIGMTTVMLFLSLMVVVINFTSTLTRSITNREEEEILRAKKERQRKAAEARAAAQHPQVEDNGVPVAVFAAAIAAYEAEKLRC